MKLKPGIFTVTVGLLLGLSCSLFAFENNADESLSRGKRLYADGRYEEAMDNFIDVFVSGNTDQIAEANEYVNLIHFDRGGVVAPKQVPYDEELEKRQNLGVRGKNLFDKPSQKEAKPQKKETGPLREVFIKEKEEAAVPEPSASEPEADPFGSQKAVPATEGEQQSSSAEAVTPVEESDLIVEKDAIVEEEQTFPRGSKMRVRSLQKKKEKEQRQNLIKQVIERLNANEDVQVYMRANRVDAIDINSAAIFQGRNIGKSSSSILDDVYALMILENAPSYVILPEGSYTDDVTLYGVRQAVTLNSYLINRGISPSKMNLNMGLTTQEPPEKFSNLAGISIVFDYDGKARLKSKLKEKNLPPVLSLAVYPFKEIVPSAGEVFVIDFSVIEGSAPIKEWALQIVSHAADDHYYIVKQLSGDNVVNHQTFWNGHKRYFGHLLPYGKYTIVLRAVDMAGRERILKRQVILKEAEKKIEEPVMKTVSEVEKAEKIKKAKEAKEAKKKEEGNLDYSQKRLWTKPATKKMGGVFEEDEPIAPVTSSVTQSVTQETSYQVEETTDKTDNVTDIPEEPAVETNTSSYGATNNPYTNTDSGTESNPYEF